MPKRPSSQRFLIHKPFPYLSRPLARLQPILARPGKPSVDLDRLVTIIEGAAIVEDLIQVQSPEHWETLVRELDDSIDAILPLSNPAYPTEIWNAHPQPLIDRGLPVVFWSLIEHEEPDFWRYAARNMLQTLGAEVHIVENNQDGITLVKALAMKRFLRQSKLVVFGKQNFPWNALAVGDRVTESLGTKILVRPIEDYRERYPKFSDEIVQQTWKERQGDRYIEKDVRIGELHQALRTFLAIREILVEERAIGFGVNCFGDLIIGGCRDVPCLAQLFLREEGYIAACDGDFIAMISMALGTYYLDKPCMTSNLYPVSYVGALTDHFGDPLSPGKGYLKTSWKNLARMAHCGFVGVVSPEMTPTGKSILRDWGGTYEIKRDGSGCGIDGDLIGGESITVVSLNFGARELMVTSGQVAETTRHEHMPHCESSALLSLNDLPGFFEAVSRDHVVLFYGDHVREFEILTSVLNLECTIF